MRKLFLKDGDDKELDLFNHYKNSFEFIVKNYYQNFWKIIMMIYLIKTIIL